MRKYFLLLLLTSFLITAQESNHQKGVKGKISEIETGKPVSNCMVFLHELDKKTTTLFTTDSTGNYTFDEIEGKFVILEVQHQNYDGAEYGPLRLKNNTLKINFDLTPVETINEDQNAETAEIQKILEKAGFNERKESGGGEFLTASEIKNYDFNSWQQAVQIIPNLQFSSYGYLTTRKISTSISGGGPVLVYVDGTLINSSIEGVVDINSVAGIEFYSRHSSAPIQYQKMNSTNGILLVWSK